MEYKEVAAVLCDIESHVAIERLRYRGISAWPVLRLMIWRQLSGGVSGKGKAPPCFEKLRRRMETAAVLFRALFKRRVECASAHAVFLVASGERYFEVDGEMISPFADSLREYAEEFGIRSVTLDLSYARSPLYGRPYTLKFEMILPQLHARLRRIWRGSAEPTGSIVAFDELAAHVGKAHPGLRLGEAEAVAEIDLIHAMRDVFLRILKPISPKVGFLVCYYQPIAMAYILACRELGIRSVDLQHGQQGDYHAMYANWTKPERYDLLPDAFWCWGERSAERINRWSRPVWPAHQAVIGGNSWMARQIHRPGSLMQEAELDRLTAPGNVHVLLALQPITDALPEPILQAIADAPPHIRWLVRLHPVMRGHREAEIREQLATTGNPNVEMDLSTSLLLDGLLRRSDFIVTLWSSVAYEALLFGVHPVIVHENGLKSFRSYIKRGLFSFANTSEAILAVLTQERSEFNFREDVPYIETREDVIRETLNRVMRPVDARQSGSIADRKPLPWEP